jgi:hypothetical protein
MTTSNIADVAATALSRYSLFLLRFGQLDTEGSGIVAAVPSSEPTAKNLQLARGINAKSRNFSVALR